MEDENNVVINYYKNNLTTILNSYDDDISYLFYSIVYKRIVARYGEIDKEEKILEELVRTGKIYTASIVARNGLFDDRNGNILINHFLDKLTTTIFHEIVHKISWIKSGKKGNNLNIVSNEGGTNIITNEALKSFDGKMLYFGKYFAMHPNIINGGYLTYELFMSQINHIIGNEALPRSILSGNNLFDKECEDFFGKEKYDKLVDSISAIQAKNADYWYCYRYDKDRQGQVEQEVEEMVISTQNDLLTYSFNKMLSKVTSKEEAEEYLTKLRDFSKYRIRKFNGKRTEDLFFVKYFNAKKKDIEQRLGTSVDVFYDDTKWDSQYKFLNLDVKEVSDSEYGEIKKLGKEKRKKIKFNRIKSLFGMDNIRITTYNKPLYKGKAEFEKVQLELINDLQEKYKEGIEPKEKLEDR